MAIVLTIATVGLLAGTLATPTVRESYYRHRLQSDDAGFRVGALNELAGMARQGRKVAPALVDGLLAENARTNAVSPETIARIAVWAIEHSPAVHQRMRDLLDTEDNARFSTLADWLAAAGRWNADQVAIEALARREVIGLAADPPSQRTAALHALERLGPLAGPFLCEALAGLNGDPDAEVRQAAVVTAAVCLDADVATETLLLPALDDPSAAVRRAAVLYIGVVQPTALADRAGHLYAAGDPSVNAALLGTLRGTNAGRELALAAVAAADPLARRLAVWTLGAVPADDGALVTTLTELLDDPDPLVRARAAIALGRLGAPLDERRRLVALVADGAADVRLAALYALGRCASGADGPGPAVRAARAALDLSIREGDGATAAAALESLGRLDDRSFLQVMLDIVDEFADQPVLQYAAACAAAEIDPEAGVQALLETCAADADEIRELAAFRISRLAHVPIDQLLSALHGGGEPLRGSAALALALAGCGEPTPGQSFAQWLTRRLDPNDPDLEPSWRVRSNYACARLICDQDRNVGDLDLYLLNEHVSRTGLYLALLATGRTLPLDMLLAEPPTVDLISFLRDARFGEVLEAYFPDAPVASWQEDADLHDWQVARLREWWRVQRWRVCFGLTQRQYVRATGSR